MYLYFGLNINDLEDFCQLMDKEENEAYVVNDRVFINKRDGVFIKTFIAKLIHVTEESFVIIGFDDRSRALRPLNLITLKSFKNCNKEIRVKLFDAVSNVNTRDNFKYTVRNGSTKSEDDIKSKKEEPRITNKLEEQWSWDCKPLNMSKRETEMIIKDIKKNGPATIIFWLDGEKTIVKCQPGDQDDIEKGVIMALVKGIQMRYKGYNFDGHKNWTNIFDIPYADEVDVEKVIGLAFLREWFTNPNRYDHEWYYNYVLRWVYKIKEYKFEDEVAALKARGYSDERIKKCLKTTKGKIREALGQDLVYKKEQKIPAKVKYNEKFIDHIKMPSGDEYTFAVNKEETKKVLKDIIQEDSLSEKVIKMFNDGTKIAKIAKSLGISEYFVKKALDEATKPKANPRKAERILKKATKEKIVHKKHIRHTEIEYPDYLDKETCDMVLERTKEKYKDHEKIQYLSELQKYFIMECKREYIITHYGNGYDMYTIAKVLGINAASVQRIWNACKSGKEQ